MIPHEYTEAEKEQRIIDLELAVKLEEIQNMIIKSNNENVDAIEKIIERLLGYPRE